MKVKPPLPPPPPTFMPPAIGAGASGEGPQYHGSRHAATVGSSVEDKLWPDKHRPRDLSSLAVHAKKVCLMEGVGFKEAPAKGRGGV